MLASARFASPAGDDPQLGVAQATSKDLLERTKEEGTQIQTDTDVLEYGSRTAVFSDLHIEIGLGSSDWGQVYWSKVEQNHFDYFTSEVLNNGPGKPTWPNTKLIYRLNSKFENIPASLLNFLIEYDDLIKTAADRAISQSVRKKVIDGGQASLFKSVISLRFNVDSAFWEEHEQMKSTGQNDLEQFKVKLEKHIGSFISKNLQALVKRRYDTSIQTSSLQD